MILWTKCTEWEVFLSHITGLLGAAYPAGIVMPSRSCLWFVVVCLLYFYSDFLNNIVVNGICLVWLNIPIQNLQFISKEQKQHFHHSWNREGCRYWQIHKMCSLWSLLIREIKKTSVNANNMCIMSFGMSCQIEIIGQFLNGFGPADSRYFELLLSYVTANSTLFIAFFDPIWVCVSVSFLSLSAIHIDQCSTLLSLNRLLTIFTVITSLYAGGY